MYCMGVDGHHNKRRDIPTSVASAVVSSVWFVGVCHCTGQSHGGEYEKKGGRLVTDSTGKMEDA